MLCNLSASLTTMTLMSFDIASTIFWRFSASASVRLDMESLSSLLTPSTNSATSLLNFFSITLFGIPVSSITSCSIAAERLSSSILKELRIEATAMGCVT